MSDSSSESEWIIDEGEHTQGYSYIRNYLGEQPKAKGGPPFSKSYVGYINTHKNVLIVAGEVNKTDYPTNKFVLFGVDYWNIPYLALQSVVPSWTYPIEGGRREAREAAERLKTAVSETDSALTGVSENNDMRKCIVGSVEDTNESADNSLSQYLTDYMISVQTERKTPEISWSCCECGKRPNHESQDQISYHILKSNGCFYPYRYWCPEHPVSDVDELDYRIPSKEEAIDYTENFDVRGAEVGSDRMKKFTFYGTLLESGMLPIKKEYILRCDINASHTDSSSKFVSMVNTTIVDETTRR
jgi:hypothetical protein